MGAMAVRTHVLSQVVLSSVSVCPSSVSTNIVSTNAGSPSKARLCYRIPSHINSYSQWKCAVYTEILSVCEIETKNTDDRELSLVMGVLKYTGWY